MHVLNKVYCRKKLSPKKWFFYDLNLKNNRNILFSLNKEIGVIFFSKTKTDYYKLLKKIEPLINFCKKKKIVFVVPYSTYWANKYKAFGILLENSDVVLNNLKNILDLNKRFRIVCKVHNYIEAVKKKKIADIIFVSPVYKTKSHPDQTPLKNFVFLYICHLLKKKQLFALGGMNDKNFKTKNSIFLSGYGGINTFGNDNV